MNSIPEQLESDATTMSKDNETGGTNVSNLTTSMISKDTSATVASTTNEVDSCVNATCAGSSQTSETKLKSMIIETKIEKKAEYIIPSFSESSKASAVVRDILDNSFVDTRGAGSLTTSLLAGTKSQDSRGMISDFMMKGDNQKHEQFTSPETIFFVSSAVVLTAWFGMLSIVYIFCPVNNISATDNGITKENVWAYLPDEERRAAQLAMIIHLVAFVLQIMKIGVNKFSIDSASAVFFQVAAAAKKNFIPRKRVVESTGCSRTSTNTFLSSFMIQNAGIGILFAGFTVQFVSFATNGLLAFTPTMVMIDPVTRSRVFLIRWCEWIPLSGFMTFLSECLDVSPGNENDDEADPSKKKDDNQKDQKVESDPIALKTIVIWALSQTASCIPGIVFPFCTDLVTWNLVMLFSMVTYFCIFARVLVRRRLYLEALAKHKFKLSGQMEAEQREKISVSKMNSSTASANHEQPTYLFSTSNLLLHEQEKVQRKRFSYYLILTCSCVWTFLVIIYFLNMLLHLYVPVSIIERYVVKNTSSIAMIFDTFFDVVAKIVYMRLIIDVYLDVFDPSNKIQRQLNELRRLVSAIWESSSDVIAISVRIHPYNANRVVCMLSPSFVSLIRIRKTGDTFVSKDGSESSFNGNDNEISGGTSTKMPKPSNIQVLTSAALMLELDIPSNEVCNDDLSPNFKVLSAYFVDSLSIAMPSSSNKKETIIVLEDLNSHTVVEASKMVAKSWDGMDYNLPNLHDNKDDQSILDVSTRSERVESDQSKRIADNMFIQDKVDLLFPKCTLQDICMLTTDGTELTCEMKVSKHAENAIVAVVRDVTERDRRFEAERKAHAETLARQRDAQAANRFTRHEVKNGLLAGIELCDNMRTSLAELKNSLIQELQVAAMEALVQQQLIHQREIQSATQHPNPQLIAQEIIAKLPSLSEEAFSEKLDNLLQDGVTKHIGELDRTLQEVLETTLTEAMSREVVHEVYIPRMERANVHSLFERTGSALKKELFPVIIADKGKIPELLLDIQLLTYIHRNAVSNACKYGRLGGVVATRVRYDLEDHILYLEVVNEPGFGHQELLDMGEAANDAVFQQGVRLQAHNKGEADGSASGDSRASSGDGAWIMQKCAMTLGGACSIEFLNDKTIFSFICPAPLALCNDVPSFQEFRVPVGTWGIAFDDSSIQRKLMDRILANVGVDEDKRILYGEKKSDIQTMIVTLNERLQSYPESRFLILMDENLDFVGENNMQELISGSFAVKELLKTLNPDQEARVLALIRSANDSAEEISWYSDRSHGFFPKATMQRDRVREILGPLWEQRFNTR